MSDLKEALARAGIDVSRFAWFRQRPEPIARLDVEGMDAVAVWRQLRGLTASTGHYPLLVGEEEDVSRHNEAIDSAPEPTAAASIIEAAEASLEPVAWAREHLLVQAEELSSDGDDCTEEYQRTLDLLERAPATWPDADPLQDFSIPTDISTGEPLPSVGLLLLPTRVPWQVPAYLRFGDWNDCPSPEHHVAMMRAWERQYGAEVVGISGDVVEMTVARPPTTRAEAARLAVVQFAYCRDLVDQGVGSVEALAAALLDAPIWYFWWD